MGACFGRLDISCDFHKAWRGRVQANDQTDREPHEAYGEPRAQAKRVTDEVSYTQSDGSKSSAFTKADGSKSPAFSQANGQTDRETHETYGESHAQAKRITDEVSYTQADGSKSRAFLEADGSKSRAFLQADGPFGGSHAEAYESPNAETYHADRAAYWSAEHESDSAAVGAAIGAAHRTAYRGAYHN